MTLPHDPICLYFDEKAGMDSTSQKQYDVNCRENVFKTAMVKKNNKNKK